MKVVMPSFLSSKSLDDFSVSRSPPYRMTSEAMMTLGIKYINLEFLMSKEPFEPSLIHVYDQTAVLLAQNMVSSHPLGMMMKRVNLAGDHHFSLT